jgi:hypothetical protein
LENRNQQVFRELAFASVRAYRWLMQPKTTLHVLLLQERVGDEFVWVAQCVDHDVTGQGNTVAEAQDDFLRVLGTEMRLALSKGEVPLLRIPPAPAQFRELWERAVRLADALPIAAEHPAEAQFRLAA